MRKRRQRASRHSWTVGSRNALGRSVALDLGCGRGQYTPELARPGWEAIGIDYVPSAIAATHSKAVDGVTYVVGDITDLTSAGLGTRRGSAGR